MTVRLRTVGWIGAFIVVMGAYHHNAQAQSNRGVVSFIDCTETQERKLWEALFYASAAIESDAYRQCVTNSVFGTQMLRTRQESDWVGPYGPCVADSYPYSAVQWSNEFAYTLWLYAGHFGNSNVEMVCDPTLTSTAATPNTHIFDHTQRETVRMEFSDRIFFDKPDHHPNQDPEWGGYPLEEVAGIIIHEVMHHYAFHHGTSSNNFCQFDSYTCPASTPNGSTCRMNSVPEIVEACVSEVLEASQECYGFADQGMCGYDGLLLVRSTESYGARHVDEADEDCECVEASRPITRWPVVLELENVDAADVTIVPTHTYDSGWPGAKGECLASQRSVDTSPDGTVLLTACNIDAGAEFTVEFSDAVVCTECKACVVEFPAVNNTMRMPRLGFRNPVVARCQ
ncbi:MAG: hypothetical protein MJB57_11375 [Gemmatimonadetes bacterium]|nr:hypothetical protein [Gemmatimonadota bacterium]